MTDLLDAKQQREANIISTFLEMVRSHDGDFDVLDRLGKATSDLESLKPILALAKWIWKNVIAQPSKINKK